MASANGRESPGLSEELLGEPHRFDFFQAVRLLELLARERGAEGAGRQRFPVGHDHGPDREAVRFRALPSLGFPAAAIAQLRQPPAAGGGPDGAFPPPEMVVAFLGLTGPQGVLPEHYTTLLLRRLRTRDFALRDFLDLFHHRVVSLFYRAWGKYRLPFVYERARLEGAGEDLCSWALFCLVGLGTDGLRGRLAIDDEAFVYYGGLFAQQTRPAVSLEGMLQDYFRMPVELLQAQGQWLTLDEADRSRMPGVGLRFGRNCELGVNLIAGERVYDVQSKFRLRVGPLGYAQFRDFMPSGNGLRALCQMARAFAGPEFDFDVQPLLRAAEVPWCRLTEGEDGPHLGWNTWVRCGDFTRDVDSAVFFLDDV